MFMKNMLYVSIEKTLCMMQTEAKHETKNVYALFHSNT